MLPAKGRDTSANDKIPLVCVRRKVKGEHAMTKFHRDVLDANRRENMRIPYIVIELPLSANSKGPESLVHMSNPVVGMTPISASVSTRNHCLETVLQIKKRTLSRPAFEVSIGNRPCRSQIKHGVVGIGELPHQNCDCNSTTAYLKPSKQSQQDN